MVSPPFLKKGDLVSIVAPAGKVRNAALQDAIRILEDWGLRVSLGVHLYDNSHSYLASTDQNRCQDLQSAINDPNVAAVLCARGGYGITRVLDQIGFDTFIKKPKWIVGFSDITALHLRLSNLGCQSIHGVMPMLFTRQNAEPSVDSLRRLLFGERIKYYSNPNSNNREGTSFGELVGGNLSLIVDSIGTKSDPDTKGKILVIEEIEEPKYKLDRMMTHLKRAGKLSGLAGLIIGYMSNISETENPFGESVEEIILDKVKEFEYPVSFGFPTGHDFPNLAWRCGAEAELKITSEGGSLTYLEKNPSA
ncbi:MAG TPA: LD-carboxypeptidase [Cyclobacteriaceae bacterium]|nr:LD-carboxypeptidase [Cyclobacteriaceae bacterium]